MRRRAMPVLMMVFALAGAGAPAARAQEGSAEPRVVSAPASAQQAGLQSDAVVSAPSGLPRRAPEPRTMEGYWPVFAVFSVTWIGIVGYLLAIGRRSRRLAKRLSGTEALS